jgi:hypothetical protein
MRRQAHRQRFAEAVGAVVPPVHIDRGHSKIRPLWKLRRDKSFHQRRVDAGATVDARVHDR